MAAKRKPNPPTQKDMFPARKKLAEAEAPPLAREVAHLLKEVDYLRGYAKGVTERVDLIVAQTDDKFTRIENEVADIRSNVQRLAHAVELLNKRSARGKKEPKKWTSEEYIRLDGEYDLMLHVDGEVDEDVLMGIHNCTILELNEALAHLRKPGYAA
jgi:uncharacterized protein YhaN